MEDDFDPNFNGVWIPRKILLHPDLKSHEVLLFAQIAALSANARGCFAQNAYFMKFLKLAKSTVSELIKGLQDKGLIDILTGKAPDGQDERQMFLSVEGAQLFAPDVPVKTVTPRSPERTPPFAGANTPVRPSEPENKYINISLCAYTREELEQFYHDVLEAAGDAIDLDRHPMMAVIRDLLYLLNDLPTSPACTMAEVLDGVRFAARCMVARHGKGSMKSWDFASTKAREFRDKRINGQPVKVVEAKVVEGIGEPSSFDAARWRTVIMLSNSRDAAWKSEWGPPPGAPGSFVPADLVGMWKGVSEGVG